MEEEKTRQRKWRTNEQRLAADDEVAGVGRWCEQPQKRELGCSTTNVQEAT